MTVAGLTLGFESVVCGSVVLVWDAALIPHVGWARNLTVEACRSDSLTFFVNTDD